MNKTNNGRPLEYGARVWVIETDNPYKFYLVKKLVSNGSFWTNQVLLHNLEGFKSKKETLTKALNSKPFYRRWQRCKKNWAEELIKADGFRETLEVRVY